MSKYLLSVDPGKHHCGVAVFDIPDRRLVSAELVKTVDLRDFFLSLWCRHQIQTLVIEKPIRRAREQFKMDDLISLAIVVGQVVAIVNAPEVVYWAPHEWNRGKPKEVTHGRVRVVLTVMEKEKIRMPKAVKTLGHNVLDGVAIGLKWLGRL